eukprot:1160080-Pelagomonas_calceolata.AAC.2
MANQDNVLAALVSQPDKVLWFGYRHRFLYFSLAALIGKCSYVTLFFPFQAGKGLPATKRDGNARPKGPGRESWPDAALASACKKEK